MKKIILFISFMFTTFAIASDLTIVAVGEATLDQQAITIVKGDLTGEATIAQKNAINEYLELLANDFSFYKKYFSVNRDFKTQSFSAILTDSRLITKYKDNNAFVIITDFKAKAGGKELTVSSKLLRLKTKKIEFEQTISFNIVNLRKTAHAIADKMYTAITGSPSIFNSKIYFVSNKDGNRRRPVKELYSMDFDGRNTKRLTFHNETVVSPAVSHDGTKLAYSLITLKRGRKNVDLKLLDLTTGKVRTLSERPGVNSGAVFTADDKHILLTMSFSGTSNIYEMELATGQFTKVTSHYSSDVDPSINKEGDVMAFLSDRPGKAMIYLADPRGQEKSIKRVSFVGQFNATPRFSPNGRYIAFSSWVDARFDIYRINANGTGLVRLTKNFGSNESPTFSPDNEFIAFTSQRVISRYKADQNIYIMDRDGEILGAITENLGDCISPRWSK